MYSMWLYIGFEHLYFIVKRRRFAMITCEFLGLPLNGLSCLLPTWQCYYETDAVIFPSTLVTLANPSAPARPLSLFAANSFGKLTLFKKQNPCSLSEVAQPHCGCYILCVTPASGDLKLQVETTSLSA